MSNELKGNSKIYTRDYKLPDDGTENIKKMMTIRTMMLTILITSEAAI